MSAESPEVEKFGLVLPRRNGPHSGCPRSAQPPSERASSRIRDQPISASGQPSARAIGSGMAITRGVSMNGVGSSGAIGGRPSSSSRWLRIVPQELDAGDQTTGAGPCRDSSQPSTSEDIARPDATERTSTRTQPSPGSASSEPLKRSARSARSSIFSELTATGTGVQSSRRPPAAPPSSSEPEQAAARSAAASTAAPAIRRRPPRATRGSRTPQLPEPLEHPGGGQVRALRQGQVRVRAVGQRLPLDAPAGPGQEGADPLGAAEAVEPGLRGAVDGGEHDVRGDHGLRVDRLVPPPAPRQRHHLVLQGADDGEVAGGGDPALERRLATEVAGAGGGDPVEPGREVRILEVADRVVRGAEPSRDGGR